MKTIAKHFPAQAGDLEKINRFTRRPLSEEEVYTFSLVLCDNEIDRDLERFTIPALEALAKLFVGKTGIFDHAPSGKNQTARVFAAETAADPERRTAAGEPYTFLKAKAYMLKNEQTAPLIAEIDGGIKKEVSVGCSVGRVACSVCGAAAGGCSHQKGVSYGGVVCHHLLDEPADAYEWSFVAVPAQKNAGVVKHFSPAKEGDARPFGELAKALEAPGGAVFSSAEAAVLREKLRSLEKDAAFGAAYRRDLEREVRRLAFLAGERMEPAVLDSILKKLDAGELAAFRSSLEARLEQGQAAPQLRPSGEEGGSASGGNEGFKM